MHPQELQAWFDTLRDTLEDAYLAHDEPWKQSGMSGPAVRWTALRKPVAICIDRSGSFLDIGCANGYLLQCCRSWTAERNIQIDPYGVDISSRLVTLARQQLPQFAEHFWVANAFTWQPPQRFDFVRTELVYVPADYERQYVEYLVAHYLAPQGRLLITNYSEDDSNPARGLLPGNQPTKHLQARLAELGIHPVDYEDGYDPEQRENTRVAIVTADSF